MVKNVSIKKVKKENRISIALYCIAELLNDYWLIKVVFQALPIIWTTVILHIFHDKLYDSSTGNLNALGVILACVIVVVSAALLVLTDVKASKDKKETEKTKNDMISYQAEIDLRRELTKAETTVEERRNRHFRNSVGKIKNSDPVNIFVSKTMDPMERISTALDGLGQCFSSLSRIASNEFTLSGAIAIENTNSKNKTTPWKWISLSTMEGTASIEELLKHNSSFKLVASGRPFFYANDKKEAADNGEYYWDGRDKTYGTGSIVCSEIDEKIDNWRIRLIISISTYGKQILSQEEIDNGADIAVVYEERIRDTIIKQFEGELKEDLLWYAVEKIDFEKNKIR